MLLMSLAMRCAICSTRACAAAASRFSLGGGDRMKTFSRNGAVLAVVLALGCGSTAAQKPQYGGTLEVGNVFVTLAALSFDAAEWPWKLNHDTGMYYEQLLAGDLDKSVRRGG